MKQDNSRRPGYVTTFYSYKGGVGRTYLLANVAWLLARWGCKVLCLDWDLEAPGLYRFLAPLAGPKKGVVDILRGVGDGMPIEWRECVEDIRGKWTGDGCLHMIGAGRGDDDYVRSVQTLDWDDLSQKGLEPYMEKVRADWVAPGEYDHVLVDSRTGITDIGGICAAQLPDLLILTFTATFQSLEGAIDVAGRAERAREKMPLDRGGFNVLPIPCRLHVGEEEQLEREWNERFASKLAPIFEPWKSRKIEVRQYIANLSVPELARWSFGEQVPAKKEPLDDPKKISYTFANIAALVDHRLQKSGEVASNRQAYIERSANGSSLGQPDSSSTTPYEYDIFVSYPSEAHDEAAQFASVLKSEGLRTFIDQVDLIAGSDWSRALYAAREAASAFAVLLNENTVAGRPQWDEIIHIIRRAEESNDVRIIPIFLDEQAYSSAHPYLKRLYGLDVMSEGGIVNTAHKIAKDLKRSR